MKQLILGFSLVFCAFGISALSAQEIVPNNAISTTLDKHNITQSQAEFLFGTQNLNELNVEILPMQELKDTQGKFWFNWFGKLFKPNMICCFIVKPVR